jgi:hypothetical protein
MSDRPHGPRRPLGRVIRQHEARADRQEIRPGLGMVAEGPDGTFLYPPEVDEWEGIVGVVTTELGAASTGSGFPFTPGVGEVEIGAWSGVTVDGTGILVQAYNSVVTAIVVGKRVQLYRALGVYWAVVADC